MRVHGFRFSVGVSVTLWFYLFVSTAGIPGHQIPAAQLHHPARSYFRLAGRPQIRVRRLQGSELWVSDLRFRVLFKAQSLGFHR